jgi:RNA polymerase sigma factor (sigma-70 family)
VLSNEHDAEDAFQATFLVLVRKAASIRRRASVASWLYGVAHRNAVRARANAQRLRGSDLLDVAGSANVVSEASGREVQAILEEELAQLPEHLRAPLLLCCLEGRSRTEAARQLGWREGTVASRLARARQRLRVRLAHRGVTLSVGALAGLLARDAAAVPITTAAAVVRIVGLFALGDAAAAPALSTPVTALAKATLQAMFVTKLKVGAALALVCGILAAGAGLAVQRVLEEGGTAAVQRDRPQVVAERADTQKPTAPRQTLTDYYGDPLPPGALARLGTVQFRHPFAHVAFAHVAFSADGETLLSAGKDWTVRSWNKSTAKQVQLRHLGRSGTDPFEEAVLAPGGKKLAVFGKETVYLYETVTGQELRRIAVGPASHERLAFSPDGQTLATMSGLGGRYSIRLWDVSTGKERLVLRHERRIQDFAFSPDGKLLASAGGDNVLHLSETTTGNELRNVDAEEGCVAFSPDGKTVAVGNHSGTVTLWETATLKEQATLKPAAPSSTSFCLAYSPDGTLLAVGGDKDLVLWDITARKEQRRLPERKTRQLAFTPDSKTLACAGEWEIHLWDVTTGLELHPRPGHDGRVLSVAVSSDGKFVASASWGDPIVHLWDAATGKPHALCLSHDKFVSSCQFSADDKLLVTIAERTLRIWDMATGRELRRFAIEDPNGGVLGCHLSPDGKRLAAVSVTHEDAPQRDRCQMCVWEARTGKLLARRPFQGFLSSRFTHPRFTPDGECVTADSKECLTIEETTTGRELARIPGDLGHPVAISPDSKLIAVGIHETLDVPRGGWKPRGVRVAEVATGQELFHLDGRIDFVAFSRDGRVLATADPDAIRLWDAFTGAQLFRRPWPESLVRDQWLTPFALFPGTRAMATGMADGTILVWDLAPETWPTIGSVKDLNRSALDRLWTDLADGDARKAYQAIHTLAAQPSQAVPFLGDHLQPAADADPEKVRQLITDLDSDRFAVRAAAAKELSGLGERIEPALRQALEGKLSAEVRKRVEALLAAPPTPPRPETLRTLRAIQVLERIGTPEAQQILRKLAAGAAAARETRDAKDALERLASARE